MMHFVFAVLMMAPNVRASENIKINHVTPLPTAPGPKWKEGSCKLKMNIDQVQISKDKVAETAVNHELIRFGF